MTCSIIDLMSDLWTLIAQVSSPPDVYHLALTSKRFHDHRLAAKLLHESLLSSLAAVLKSRGYPLSAFSFASAATDFPGALLVGGIMVQACLGDTTKQGDVGVFVTAASAPAVRTHLVAHEIGLAGFSEGYGGHDAIPGYWKEANSGVHHVVRARLLAIQLPQ
jgi:hypothetical protein